MLEILINRIKDRNRIINLETLKLQILKHSKNKTRVREVKVLSQTKFKVTKLNLSYIIATVVILLNRIKFMKFKVLLKIRKQVQ